MVANHKSLGWPCLVAALISIAICPGCGTPPATLELISVAREALTDARQYDSARHAEALQRLESTKVALDAAFDADVKLVEAGGIADSAGRPVRLTADWVISARKGYAIGRDALAEQRHRVETSHVTHLDNLSAGSEALDLARDLIILHSTLTGRARQFVMSLQRRLTHDGSENQ